MIECIVHSTIILFLFPKVQIFDASSCFRRFISLCFLSVCTRKEPQVLHHVFACLLQRSRSLQHASRSSTVFWTAHEEHDQLLHLPSSQRQRKHRDCCFILGCKSTPRPELVSTRVCKHGVLSRRCPPPFAQSLGASALSPHVREKNSARPQIVSALK